MKSEIGRSMVEMLGVLAIIGIVGMGGVKMYNVAMNKHHANTLIEQAQRRAVSAASQINLMGHAPSLADFSENSFGGGTFGGVTQEGLSKQFGIQVSGVSKPVCENILSSIGTSSAIRRLSPTDNPQTSLKSCQEENTFLIVYNDDLSSSGGDTIYCDNSACQTVCGQCVSEDGENKCINECPATPTQCTQNSQCSGTCVGCVIPEGETTGTCQSCQRVAYLESTGTQWIDTGYIVNNNITDLEIDATVAWSKSNSTQLSGGNSSQWIGIQGAKWRTGTSSLSQNSIILNQFYNVNSHVFINNNRQNNNTYVDGDLAVSMIGSNTQYLTRNKHYIFGINTAGAQYIASSFLCSMKINRWQITEQGILVRDFIPVHAPFKEVGKQNCMFDRVSGDLFCNQGTGDFIVPIN